MRIEIAGALATGKSTLAGILERKGLHLVREDLSSNPYLDLRKVAPEKYEFLCQQRFVQDKVAAITKAVRSGPEWVVSDFSLVAEKAYVRHYLSHRPEWVESLVEQMDAGWRETGAPGVIIYLSCHSETQLSRIKERGRGFEQGHDLTFINAINALVDEEVTKACAAGTRVVEINVDRISPHEAADCIYDLFPQAPWTSELEG